MLHEGFIENVCKEYDFEDDEKQFYVFTVFFIKMKEMYLFFERIKLNVIWIISEIV